ncbi:MAG: signal peptidase I [Cetobacterium sp.]
MKNYNKLKKYFLIIMSLILGTYLLGEVIEINLSPSMPVGIYREYKAIKTDIEKEDIVIFPIPEKVESYVHGRGYLPKDIKNLMKRVKGITGDKIEIKDYKLYINGKYIKNVRKLDSLGMKLPEVNGQSFIVKENELFVLGDEENSFDSLYFGVIQREDVTKKAKYLFVKEIAIKNQSTALN